jgi:hypothetical protein
VPPHDPVDRSGADPAADGREVAYCDNCGAILVP